VTYLRDKIRHFTDDLLESLELTLNRYSAAKPDLFGDVVVLRDGTSSYQDLKGQLISLSAAGRIVDPVGHCTTGYGTLLHTGNCDGRPSEQAWADGITEAKATELLERPPPSSSSSSTTR